MGSSAERGATVSAPRPPHPARSLTTHDAQAAERGNQQRRWVATQLLASTDGASDEAAVKRALAVKRRLDEREERRAEERAKGSARAAEAEAKAKAEAEARVEAEMEAGTEAGMEASVGMGAAGAAEGPGGAAATRALQKASTMEALGLDKEGILKASNKEGGAEQRHSEGGGRAATGMRGAHSAVQEGMLDGARRAGGGIAELSGGEGQGRSTGAGGPTRA